MFGNECYQKNKLHIKFNKKNYKRSKIYSEMEECLVVGNDYQYYGLSDSCDNYGP